MSCPDPPLRFRGRTGRAARSEAAGLLAGCFLLAACATTANLKEARGTGLTRTFEGGFEEVFTAAVESVRGLGLQVDEVNEEEGWIAATRHPTGPGPGAPEDAVSVQADQGERVGVFVEGAAPGRWEVEVVTLRLFELDPSKLEWAEEIFFSMEMRLDPEGRFRIPDSALPPHR